MRYAKNITIIVVVAIVFFVIGNNNKESLPEKTIVNTNVVEFELAVKNYPRGSLGEPAQWFMMESLVGWENMMFIYGYADNKESCDHLVDVAKAESPQRNFKCEDAN